MCMILTCKMCGGTVEVTPDITVGKCAYCGSTMTLPRIESEKKARLFNKANEYRLNNEFDKAYEAYKTIVEEDEQEAEAYWGMILSEYGIEYVEDPTSHKRIATVHRTHVQNIQNSTNYKLALKYADAERRFMYQDEAEQLDNLQRSILAVSSKEEPYDVFICYKESNENGQRTEDSVLAQEIYTELEKDNIKTFFARISLEDHIGENYEPYIYGALTSARVMLLVSTDGQHCNSVWVKNEWKRFISFMEEDSAKAIIPVYKVMTPYEFPSEVTQFQAQDMGKVGAIQDLVRGVQKLLGQTATDKANAALNSLIADKLERDEKDAKKKKLKKKAIACICLISIIIGGYFGIFVGLPKIIYREKATTVTTGTPNPEDYNTFTVELTDTNWDEYFYLEECLDNVWMLRSKVYDDGWYYYDGKGINCRILWGSHGVRATSMPCYFYCESDDPWIYSMSGTVTFVYEGIVKEYDQDAAYRKIVLKNGDVKDDTEHEVDEYGKLLGDFPY